MTTRFVRSWISLLALVLLGSACADEGTNIDPVLVGEWESMADTPIPLRVAFFDDGTFAFANDGAGPGEYEADGERLTLMDGDEQQNTETGTYFANDEFWMWPAFLPDGDVDGVVGRWRLQLERSADAPGNGPDVFDGYVTLNADGTFSSTETETGSGTNEYEGTYEITGPNQLVLDIEDDEPFELAFVPGKALGVSGWTRVID